MPIHRRRRLQFRHVTGPCLADDHVRMARCDVDLPRFNLFVSLGLDDMGRAQRIQPLGEGSGESFRHMLND